MADDWGDVTELQIQDIIAKQASLFSHTTGLKLPEVSWDSTEPVPRKTLRDYIKVNGSEYDDESQDFSAAEQYLLEQFLRNNVLETTVDVNIQRRKDNSPLYSMKSFSELHIPPHLLQGINAMGFDTPSKIQETSLPALLANPPMNMIAQSQSGTGKTAAFLLASLARINTDLNYPQVLILSPTYELALQIGEVAEKMAKYCPSMTCRYAVQKERFQRGGSISEHMLIGTPGKVMDWAKRRKCFEMEKINVFVLDEADVMISIQGHHDQCIRIHQMLSSDCQMLLFSATYTPEVIGFAEQIITDPIIIRVRKEEETLDNIQQYFIRCSSPDVKYTALSNIYGAISIGQTIIFCRTKRTACSLGEKLTDDGHSVGYLSSDLSVQDRYDVLSRFRAGTQKVLITTNVLSRGIDVEQVTMVVNFDLPVTVNGKADCETYLHRIGRTGRFGKSGIAVNLVCSDDDEQILKTIENHFGRTILKINADNADELEAIYQ